MAHIQDLWEKTVDGRRVRTDRHGKGRRWQARYLDADGRDRTKMFDRKQDAERELAVFKQLDEARKQREGVKPAGAMTKETPALPELPASVSADGAKPPQ